MRWQKPPKDPTAWQPWFAWHPVRLGRACACSGSEGGTRVWLERILRRWDNGMQMWEYAEWID